MDKNNFFNEQQEQSRVKSTIVAKYFDVWANIIINTQKKHPYHSQKIAYIDLFAGPGRYKDGTQSTPLKILENAISKPELKERLVTVFNDKDSDNSKSLEKAIKNISGINRLKYTPIIKSLIVGEEIAKMFEEMKLIPTLFFVDPWGYKGLSLRLINSVLKDWGCDAIFFFNYNRINMGINNDAVKEPIQALFGKELADSLKIKLNGKSTKERELLIVEDLCQTLKSFGSRYVLPFRFKNDKGKRTSHHLIFVSKNFRGYEIMKEIMTCESSNGFQGVASFEYNPSDLLDKQTLLFQLSRPLDDLKDDLQTCFKGSTLTMKEIYKNHNVDTPYIKRHYKEVLRKMYDDNIIKAISYKGNPPRKGIFGDDIIVTFP